MWIVADQATSTSFNPNNPLERHAGESRHPAIEIDREADKTKVLSYLRRDLLINWIPAFAGMTLFCPDGQSGFSSSSSGSNFAPNN
jgi:hypothetical protein